MKSKHKLGDKMLLTFTKFTVAGARGRRQLRNRGGGKRRCRKARALEEEVGNLSAGPVRNKPQDP